MTKIGVLFLNFIKAIVIILVILMKKINGTNEVTNEYIFERTGVFEGYATSVLAIKYLVDVYGESYVFSLMFNNDEIRKIGNNILSTISEYYDKLYNVEMSK